MGTAVTGMNEEEGVESPPVKREASASMGAADAASACHSFWEVGAGAGVKGAEGCDGLVQHAGVEHFEQSDSQHLQVTRGAEVAVSADTVKTPCHVRATPRTIARSIFTALKGRADICVR